MFWQPEMSVKPKATFVYRDIYFDDFENLVDKFIVVTKWGNFLVLLYKFIIHSKIAWSQMSAIILRILVFLLTHYVFSFILIHLQIYTVRLIRFSQGIES